MPHGGTGLQLQKFLTTAWIPCWGPSGLHSEASQREIFAKTNKENGTFKHNMDSGMVMQNTVLPLGKHR